MGWTRCRRRSRRAVPGGPGWQRRAGLARAGPRVGRAGCRLLVQRLEGETDRGFQLRIAVLRPVGRRDVHLDVRVDAVVFHAPAELVERERQLRDGDPGAIHELAPLVETDHATPGTGADYRPETEQADGRGDDVAVGGRVLVGQ